MLSPKRLPAALLLLLTLVFPRVSAAQAVPDSDSSEPPAAITQDAPAESAGPAAAAVPPSRPEPFFQALKGDYRTFFTSSSTARTMVVFGTGALSVARWDGPATRSAHAHWSDDVFDGGSQAGGLLAQMALAGGTYAIGRMSGKSGVERIGSELLRAQLLSQSVIQVTKFATNRTRPDGSNNQSFPSGHTASAFATATVLQRELGWKVGVPAYAFAAWVGASRMEANKHYMSDVLLGAGVGIASAHSVTMDVRGQKFAVGVAPASRGAVVTLTKR